MATRLERQPGLPELTIVTENLDEIEARAKAQHKKVYAATVNTMGLDTVNEFEVPTFVNFRPFWMAWQGIHTKVALSMMGYSHIGLLRPYRDPFSEEGRYIHLDGRPPESVYNSDSSIAQQIKDLDEKADSGEMFDFAVLVGESYFARCRVFCPRTIQVIVPEDFVERINGGENPDNFSSQDKVVRDHGWRVFKITDASTLSIPPNPTK